MANAIPNGAAANNVTSGVSKNPFDASLGQSNLRDGVTDISSMTPMRATDEDWKKDMPIAPDPEDYRPEHFWDLFTAGNAYKRARAQYEYEMQMWREDHAIQRKMADLKAAGVNPLLAVSGMASGEPANAHTYDNEQKPNIGLPVAMILAALLKNLFK